MANIASAFGSKRSPGKKIGIDKFLVGVKANNYKTTESNVGLSESLKFFAKRNKVKNDSRKS